MLYLREAHGLTPERVAKIESWTHPRRLAHTNRPDPVSGLDGKFSIQYVLARALMHGIVSLEHFSDDAVHDVAARALMARIHAAPGPDALSDTGDHFYARLRITMTAGATFEHFVDAPLGRDREHPLPAGTLAAKFRDCARLAIDAANTEALLQFCNELETIADVADGMNIMAAGAAARAGIEPSGGARSRAYA
jgi:2-methylcitrate dehydratase PrpD